MFKDEVSKIYTNSNNVSCDGTISSSQHPLVYFHIKEGSETICPYCGIKYIFQSDKTDDDISKASKIKR